MQAVKTSLLGAYGSLAFPLAAAFIALQVIVPTFYAQSTGLSLSQIGLVLLFARLWDMFTDPLIGYLSDRTPAALGKRKSWIICSTPLIAVATWMLFNPGESATPGYLMLWTFVIYVAGTMAIVPMNAWGAELTDDYHERSRVTGVRAAFGLVGTLAALTIPAVLGQSASSDFGASLTLISYLVIVTLVITVAVSSIVVPDNSVVNSPANSIREILSLLKTPTPVRQLLGSFLLNNIGNAIPATLFLLYVTHVMEKPEFAGPLLFLYFVCATVSVPGWLALAKRFGKHQIWSVAMIMACVFFLSTPFLRPDYLWVFVVIVAITGFTSGADLVLPGAIKGDLIEWDALTNGYRRPGIFFALWGTLTKLSFALAIGIAFPLLELTGFDATKEAGAQSPLSLALLYGLPCIGFKIGAIIGMRNYPITETEHARIRDALRANEATGTP